MRLKSVIANIVDSNMAGGRKAGKKAGTAAKLKKGKNVKKSTPAVDVEDSITVEDENGSVVAESQQSHSSPTRSTDVTHSAVEEETADGESSEDEEQAESDTTVDDSQEPAAKKRKKNKPFIVLSEKEQEEVFQWVCDNDFLYNKKLSEFKDVNKKESKVG